MNEAIQKQIDIANWNRENYERNLKYGGRKERRRLLRKVQKINRKAK